MLQDQKVIASKKSHKKNDLFSQKLPKLSVEKSKLFNHFCPPEILLFEKNLKMLFLFLLPFSDWYLPYDALNPDPLLLSRMLHFDGKFWFESQKCSVRYKSRGSGIRAFYGSFFNRLMCRYCIHKCTHKHPYYTVKSANTNHLRVKQIAYNCKKILN